VSIEAYLIRSRVFLALGVPAKRCPILHAWATVENRRFCHEFMGALLCRKGTESAIRLAVRRELHALEHFLKASPYHFGTIKRGGGKNREITFYGPFTPNLAVSWIRHQLDADPDTSNPIVAIDRYVSEAIARHVPKQVKKATIKKRRTRKRRGVAYDRHILSVTFEQLLNLANCTFESALLMARLGFPVFPVWGVGDGVCQCPKGLSCANPGKHPCVSCWQQVATTYESSLARLWGKFPYANIGIATGRKLGSGEILTVIDCDYRSFGHGSISHLERNELCPLPATREHSSGGGPHKFYAYSRGFHSKTGALGQGVDVQSFGKFVIAPGSTHKTGSVYQVMIDLPIARLPDIWAERIEAVRNKTLPLIPEGRRRTWLLSCAGGMVRDGMDPSLILEVLKDRRDRRCEKGTHTFSDEDLRGMVIYCLNQERSKRVEKVA
jgi:hypothetical protein